MRNTTLQTPIKLVPTRAALQSTQPNPLISQLINTLEELQNIQKQMQYFTRETKLWSSPQRKL